MIQTDNIIDVYEDFIEELIVPIVKTTKGLAKESKLIHSLLKLRTSFIENKINLFFQNLQLKSEQEKLNFINQLTDEQKIFFAETVNKIIDLDDNLQNYIMSCLVEQYNKNSTLNYFEKKLYYNINTLSEDDFQIFYCLYNQCIIQNKTKYISITGFKQKDIIKTSLDRFVNLGIVLFEQNFVSENKHSSENQVHASNYYKESDYSSILYQYLSIYLKDFSCEYILQKTDSFIKAGNLKFY